jgi:hypothetical protein
MPSVPPSDTSCTDVAVATINKKVEYRKNILVIDIDGNMSEMLGTYLPDALPSKVGPVCLLLSKSDDGPEFQSVFDCFCFFDGITVVYYLSRYMVRCVLLDRRSVSNDFYTTTSLVVS